MRQIGLLLVSILILASCISDNGQLPTQAVLPAPTKTLIPTTEAQQIATQIAAGNVTIPAPTNEATQIELPTIEPIQVETSTIEATQILLPTIEPVQVDEQPTQAPTATEAPTLEPTQTTTSDEAQVELASSTPIPTALPTNTSEPTNTPIPCNVQDDWETYAVQRGDNLIGIANRTDSTVDELTSANCLENPNRLRVGQELYVPNVPEIPATATSISTAVESATEVSTSMLDETPPSFTVSISKTYENNIGFGLEFPAEWYVSEATAVAVDNAIITSFEYTPGDEIPQNLWTDDMVSITVSIFKDETEQSLSEWTLSAVNQFQNASNISDVLAPTQIKTDGDIEGQSIDYIASDDTIVRNYYFIINDHRVQLNIGGNFDLAVAVVNSLMLTDD